MWASVPSRCWGWTFIFARALTSLLHSTTFTILHFCSLIAALNPTFSFYILHVMKASESPWGSLIVGLLAKAGELASLWKNHIKSLLIVIFYVCGAPFLQRLLSIISLVSAWPKLFRELVTASNSVLSIRTSRLDISPISLWAVTILRDITSLNGLRLKEM